MSGKVHLMADILARGIPDYWPFGPFPTECKMCGFQVCECPIYRPLDGGFARHYYGLGVVENIGRNPDRWDDVMEATL